MKIMIVGADGFIGAELKRKAVSAGHQVAGLSRRVPPTEGNLYYDLLSPLDFPQVLKSPPDVAFLCAGLANYEKCEGNREAWRVNADGNAACGKALIRSGAFLVFLSSGAAEFAQNFAYARAKMFVEMVLQSVGDPAIVRFERVRPEGLGLVCDRLLEIGEARKPGVYRVAQ